MAAITVWTHSKDTPRVDDLCPFCFNPSLKSYQLEKIDLDGITILGSRVACTDCKRWATPLKKESTRA